MAAVLNHQAIPSIAQNPVRDKLDMYEVNSLTLTLTKALGYSQDIEYKVPKSCCGSFN